MERISFSLRIKPGMARDYLSRHQQMPASLRQAIAACGFHNYTLFLDGEAVTAYAECHPNSATAFGLLRQSTEARKWNEDLGDVITVGDAEGKIRLAKEYWHLD